MSRPDEPEAADTEPADSASGEIEARILIAEGEPRIASFIDKGLRANGFATTISDSAPQVLELAGSGAFDLVVLDLGRPAHDGLSVLRDIRARGQRIPVLMLTAPSHVADPVTALDVGTSDSLAKPFHFDELLERIRARLRDEPKSAPVGPGTTVLQAGDAQLDLRSSVLTIGTKTVQLTARECALAEVLLRYPGETFSREALISQVWGDDPNAGSTVVDGAIRDLRRKVGAKSIGVVRTVGYRWQPRKRTASR